jgi:hypothetical protein
VFAEILLLNKLDPNIDTDNIKLSDVILIPGKSCYPFTDGEDKNESKNVETIKSDD